MNCDIVLRAAAINEISDQANDAERLGFDGVGVTESTGNPFLAAAEACRGSERTRVCTAIALAFTRSPMDVAYTAWDLQRLSGGRFALGLGSQVRAHVERRFSAEWSRPAARMREYVLALHAIWDAWESGGELCFEGDFYRHTLMPPNFRPPPLGHSRPPVLLAAVRERMTEVAGEVADGLLLHAFATEATVRELTLPAVERGLERSGRDRSGFELTASVFVALDNEQWEAARRRVAFYGSTPGYSHVLAHHGLTALFEQLHDYSRAGRWQEMPALIDDDVLALFALRDTDPVALASRIKARFDGTADRLAPVADGARPEQLAALLVALSNTGSAGIKAP